LATQLPPLWARILAGEADAPREEAHLLSILYAGNGYAIGTADRFIRRMWTTFKRNTLRPEDRELAIWHLPAEKKTGFTDLFRSLAIARDEPQALSDRTIEQIFGFPRRGPRKLLRDGALKLIERLRR
jgi:hypothetical protein